MVIDKFENLKNYLALHPLFAQALDYLASVDLAAHEPGKEVLKEGDLTVIFTQAPPKTKEEAKLETHNDFIDIQLPLSDVETMGYTPRADLAETDYDAANDISFYPGLADDYLDIKPGMFAIFFPEDAHAPAISANGVKKVIVKVRVNSFN